MQKQAISLKRRNFFGKVDLKLESQLTDTEVINEDHFHPLMINGKNTNGKAQIGSACFKVARITHIKLAFKG